MNNFINQLRAFIEEASNLIITFSKVFIGASVFILFFQKLKNPEFSIDQTNTFEVIFTLIMCVILIAIIVILIKYFISVILLRFKRINKFFDNFGKYHFLIIISFFIFILASDNFSFWVLKQSRIRIENVKIIFIDKDLNAEVQSIIQNCQSGTINQIFRDTENIYFECTNFKNEKNVENKFYFPKSMIYVLPN